MLPNHYLFVLAEKPPADLAALLSLFHPVPSVIRRRSKELLDAIRGAVRNAQKETQAARQPPTDVPVAAQEDVEMDAAEAAAPSSGSAESLDLWTRSAYLIVPKSSRLTVLPGSRAPKAGTAASALLDSPVVAKVEVKGATVFAAPSSALFSGASRVCQVCSLRLSSAALG